MARQIGGYEDNLDSKGSGLREVTVSDVGDKAALDVNLLSSDMTVTNEVKVAEDLSELSLLSEIVKQLKITNMHLSKMSDEQIQKEEVE